MLLRGFRFQAVRVRWGRGGLDIRFVYYISFCPTGLVHFWSGLGFFHPFRLSLFVYGLGGYAGFSLLERIVFSLVRFVGMIGLWDALFGGKWVCLCHEGHAAMMGWECWELGRVMYFNDDARS